jgi:hypothetical protein
MSRPQESGIAGGADPQPAMDTLPETQTEKVAAIRPLAVRNRVAGHDLNEIWRRENVAVFARSIPGRPPHDYEVIIVRVAPAKVAPSGAVVPRREAYPSSDRWGKLGWSIPKRDLAIAWAQMVLANLGKPKRERTAWPELFSRFKAKL